jgi:CheY-like chemotaxis protein
MQKADGPEDGKSCPPEQSGQGWFGSSPLGVTVMQRILVIDDDPLVRHTVERILLKNGYQVCLAADGLEGLHAFRSQRPDLVITDIIMPKKEGLETIRLLRIFSPEAKIIAISGGSRIGNVDLLKKASDLGACAVIAKPFQAVELLDAVGRCSGSRTVIT